MSEKVLFEVLPENFDEDGPSSILVEGNASWVRIHQDGDTVVFEFSRWPALKQAIETVLEGTET